MNKINYQEMKERKDEVKIKIDKIGTQITELECNKVSLMMLHREMGMKMARQTLEDAFDPQLKKLLEDGVITNDE